MLVGGGNLGTAQHKRWDYQIYVPWYIACSAVRPQILTINGTMWTATTSAVPLSYGQTITLSYPVMPGLAVSKVVLMRPSSATHGANTEQRYIELDIIPPVEGAPPGQIIARMPALPPSHPLITTSDVSGPPGHYMAHLVSSGRIPSEAAWIELKP